MIIRVIALLFFTIPAYADEGIQILSGEHVGFTRLVFQIEPNSQWSLQTIEKTASLTLTGQKTKFLDQEIFNKIPKARLLSTEQLISDTSSVFQMNLSCFCVVDAFAYRESYIVVDIKDTVRAVTENDTVESSRSTPPKLSLEEDIDSPFANIFTQTPNQPSYSESGDWNLTSVSEQQSVNITDDQIVSQTDQDLDLAETVDAARDKLLGQLAMAVDQGILEFADDPIEVAEIEHKELILAEEKTEEAEVTNPPDVLVDQKQVMVQSVYERDARQQILPENSFNQTCPEVSQVDIASWGNGDSFSEELAQARRDIIGEFDKPNIDKIQTLVRIYIRYGFGIEARSYLTSFDVNVADYAVLVDLADIVDGKPAIEGIVANSSGCDGIAGVWQLVAKPENQSQEMGNPEGIIDAFAELPNDIRNLIGPRLVTAFTARGFPQEAYLVSEIINRAPGEHGSDHQISQASIAHSNGELINAENLLEKVVDEDKDKTGEAIVKLAEIRLQAEQPFALEMLFDLGAAANSHRGTKIGLDLRRYEAIWMAELQGLDSAVALLLEQEKEDPVNTEAYREIAVNLISRVDMNDIAAEVYVETILEYLDDLPTEDDSDLRLQVADNLIDIGLPNIALNVLSAIKNQDIAKLMIADANIMMSKFEEAIEILKSMRGNKADLLRIKANLYAGNMTGVLATLQKSNLEVIRQVDPYWYNGDWNNLSGQDNAALKVKNILFPDSTSPVSRVVNDETPQELSLEATKQILAESTDIVRKLEAEINLN